jgi:hypothetical protein
LFISMVALFTIGLTDLTFTTRNLSAIMHFRCQTTNY